MKRFKKYIYNILISIDQLVNTVAGGDPDETISSRVGKRVKRRGWKIAARIIDSIFFWQKDHSKNAIEEDEGKDSVLND